MGEDVSWMGENRKAHGVLAGKPQGERPQVGQSTNRSEGNIKMHLTKIGCGLEWIHQDQDRTSGRIL
jgi:hypothetical protein